MALTNKEKSILRAEARAAIAQKAPKDEFVRLMVRRGFKASTATKYYKTFSRVN